MSVTSDALTVKSLQHSYWLLVLEVGQWFSDQVPTERLHCRVGTEILGPGGQSLQFQPKLLPLLVRCSLGQGSVSASGRVALLLHW